MSETEVNIPLLRKAVEWAEAEAAKPPELCEWFQGAYIYPSLADHAQFAWDGKPYGTGVNNTMIGRAQECGTCFCVAGKVAYDALVNRDGRRAPGIAADVLGLSDEQADTLFYSDNSIADVRRIAESIAGERL